MTYAAVVTNTGKSLMPTPMYRARRLLKKGRAVIYRYHPFTIKIIDRDDGDVQEIEYKCDTGSVHVGISIASEYHEYFSAQYDMLPDEKERHDDQRRYRCARRNRLRYRKPRFDNRFIPEGWFAPSVRHKEECMMRIFKMHQEVIPITKAVFETGSFDTQMLAAIEKGERPPKGTDYQHGPRYKQETLRKAIFYRDSYTCQCCGKTIRDGIMLHMHHIGFKVNDHSDRMGNLLTVCTACHTSKNHDPGGKLYNLKPRFRPMKDAAFMNTVRWHLLDTLRKRYPDIEIRNTYGAETSAIRKDRHIIKSHANDACVMGDFHPKHRVRTRHWKKQRRNDRRLQRFYDAKYIDSRDGTVKTGKQLSSGRTSRSRWDGENLHLCREKKVSKGHINIRRSRTSLKPGSVVEFEGKRLIVKGVHRQKSNSCNVEFVHPAAGGRKSASLKKLTVIKTQYTESWKEEV